MNQKKQILCLDIGGTNCRIGLCDRELQLTDVRIESSVRMAEAGFQGSLIRLISEYAEEHAEDARIPAVSLGFPATIDRDRRIVLQAPAIPGADHFPVCDELEKRLDIPVFLERDVNLLLRFDMRDQAIPPEGVVVGIYYGTGIGNSIFINGEPYTGRNGVAGELGHIPVPGNDKACGCGNTGCLETLGGGRHLEHLCEKYYPAESVASVFRRHAEEEPLQRQLVAMASAAASR